MTELHLETELHVGAWIRREGRRLTKAHLVESIIAGDAITRCGRRMKDETYPPFIVHTGIVSRANVPMDWELCEAGCRPS